MEGRINNISIEKIEKAFYILYKIFDGDKKIIEDASGIECHVEYDNSSKEYIIKEADEERMDFIGNIEKRYKFVEFQNTLYFKELLKEMLVHYDSPIDSFYTMIDELIGFVEAINIKTSVQHNDILKMDTNAELNVTTALGNIIHININALTDEIIIDTRYTSYSGKINELETMSSTDYVNLIPDEHDESNQTMK